MSCCPKTVTQQLYRPTEENIEIKMRKKLYHNFLTMLNFPGEGGLRHARPKLKLTDYSVICSAKSDSILQTDQ